MPPPVYSVSDAAKILRVSESWLRQRVARREIPFLKLAGKIRFSEEHLIAICDMSEVPVEPVHPLLKGRK